MKFIKLFIKEVLLFQSKDKDDYVYGAAFWFIIIYLASFIIWVYNY